MPDEPVPARPPVNFGDITAADATIADAADWGADWRDWSLELEKRAAEVISVLGWEEAGPDDEYWTAMKELRALLDQRPKETEAQKGGRE